MGKEFFTFGDIEIKKHKPYRYKNHIFKKDVDIKNELVSNKISSGEKNCKYFIGYLYDGNKFKPLHVMRLKAKAYVKPFDCQTKRMHFLIEYDDVLEKYNTIWGNIKTLILKQDLIANLLTIKKFLKTKIKFYGDEATDFQDKEMQVLITLV